MKLFHIVYICLGKKYSKYVEAYTSSFAIRQLAILHRMHKLDIETIRMLS